MTSTADGFLLAGALAGIVVCWFGYRAYRMSNRLGRRSFIAFTLILGNGILITAIFALAPPVAVPESVDVLPDDLVWSQLPVLFWIVSTFPWFVFAVQYTGTRTKISRRSLVLLALPYAVLFFQLVLVTFGIQITIFDVFSTAVFTYIIALAVGGTYLLLQTTYSAGHLSVGQGISLAIVPIGLLTVWNLLGAAGESSTVFRAGVFAAGAGLVAVALVTSFRRYGLFESTPSIDTLGERALTRETDDLMFVVDDDGHIIRINETAVETIGVPQSEALGKQLNNVIDHDAKTLRQVKTVSVQTTGGSRQYDPQTAIINDHHGNELGTMLSLRDITERELREQRLAVLNRVLRHNLRNQADVVKGHAESLETEGSQVDTIIDAADSIAALGRQARKIDQYVSESPGTVAVDLSEVVNRVLETVDAEDTDVAVSVEVPPSAQVVTNEQALVSALESALDNAIKYADSSVTVTVKKRPDAYVLRIADNGPGIPEWELDSLDTATETALQHSTGIGLWQLKWGVTALNGQLSFDTDDGTIVEIVIPDRESDEMASS